jgi:hypothetical protein
VWLHSRGVVLQREQQVLGPCESESVAAYCRRVVRLQVDHASVNRAVADVAMVDAVLEGVKGATRVGGGFASSSGWVDGEGECHRHPARSGEAGGQTGIAVRASSCGGQGQYHGSCCHCSVFRSAGPAGPGGAAECAAQGAAASSPNLNWVQPAREVGPMVTHDLKQGTHVAIAVERQIPGSGLPSSRAA